jgi:ribosomal protein L7Ae-like RNA K-turn-binding protein
VDDQLDERADDRSGGEASSAPPGLDAPRADAVGEADAEAPSAATPQAQEKALRLLGLGVRARNAVVGVDRVRDAAKNGTLYLAAVAPDASGHSQDKVRPLLAAKRVRVLDVFASAALGQVAGREGATAVGVTDPNLARGILQALGVALGDLGSAPDRARGGTRPAGRAGGRGRTRRTD